MKNYRTHTLSFLVIVIAFALMLTLAACDLDSINAYLYGTEEVQEEEEKKEEGCKHDFQKANSERIDCQHKVIDVYVCTICGQRKEEETDEVGSHVYETNPYVCVLCGAVKTPVATLAKSDGKETICIYAATMSLYTLAIFECGTISGIPWSSYLSQIKDVKVYGHDIVIPDKAFYGCETLEEFTIYGTVKSIGKEAFCGCTSLEKVDLPTGIRSIGKGAFRDCTSLKEMSVANSLTYMGAEAFAGCVDLVKLTLPFIGSEDRKEEYALFGSIFGAGGTTQIYYGNQQVGFDVPDLVDVYLTKYQNIDSYVFSHMSAKIAAFHFQPDLNTLTSDGVIIDDYAFLDNSGLEKFVIDVPYGEDEIIAIGKGAFSDCSALKSFSLPWAVTALEESVFENCISLVDFDFGIASKLTTIGTRAFFKCQSLEKVILPYGVTSIASEAFSGCSHLTYIRFNAGLETMDRAVFYGCTQLKDDIYVLSNVVSAAVDTSNLFSYAEQLWIEKTLVVGDYIASRYRCEMSDYLTLVDNYEYYLWQKK